VTAWGNAESWNIGFQDPACFLATDPEAFFIGRLDGRPVSAVSLVTYGDNYAVWGHYLVNPEYRGRGYGVGVCKVAAPRAAGRTTSGDAMPEQVGNYSRDGSRPAHDTILWAGSLDRPGDPSPDVVPVTDELLEAIAAYDRTCFPALRTRFLSRWLFALGHRARVLLRDGRVAGFGVLRPAPRGHRIGPLCADTPRDAETLFDALTAELPAGEEVSIFAPDLQPAAGVLFAERGLSEHLRVVRMYRGPVPEIRGDRLYAIASLELG
jgi:hypothetical protein